VKKQDKKRAFRNSDRAKGSQGIVSVCSEMVGILGFFGNLSAV
jgi:hypothetical protein